MDIGTITATPKKYENFALYARQYLDKSLNDKLLQINKTKTVDSQTHSNPLIINEYISFIHDAEPGKTATVSVTNTEQNLALFNDTGSIKIFFTFNINEQKTGNLMCSSTITHYLKTTNKENIYKSIRFSTENFLAEYIPVSIPISANTLRGRTKYDRLGRDLIAQGKLDEALVHFLKAIDAQPNDHAALYNAGLVCEALGRYLQAQQYYLRAKTIGNRNVYNLSYQRIKQRLKQ
ncbi:MAG: tetratricopeptide repeat protein [Sedimentisphaerales bacterium]|nr:tetratricopeptide repeat protein [Sedimentisphaerales bacterium]